MSARGVQPEEAVRNGVRVSLAVRLRLEKKLYVNQLEAPSGSHFHWSVISGDYLDILMPDTSMILSGDYQ